MRQRTAYGVAARAISVSLRVDAHQIGKIRFIWKPFEHKTLLIGRWFTLILRINHAARQTEADQYYSQQSAEGYPGQTTRHCTDMADLDIYIPATFGVVPWHGR